MKPISRLFERSGLPAFGLSPALVALHGGDFGLRRPSVYANFVASLDGVVTLAGVAGESGRLISGDSEPDRFVMGLLRACADAVLIGAGTFRMAGAGDLWQAEHAYPEATDQFADLRRRLGLRPRPLLVVVTESGDLDQSRPALADALVVTTPAGQRRLAATSSAGARVMVVDAPGDGPRIRARALLKLLRGEGLQVILTEGGPTLIGELLQEGLLDELFLTTSPHLFGRSPGDGRKSLVHGADVHGQSLDLLAVRRHESHLFLRYAVSSRGPDAARGT